MFNTLSPVFAGGARQRTGRHATVKTRIRGRDHLSILGNAHFDFISGSKAHFTLVQANDLFHMAIATALYVSAFRIDVPMPQKSTNVYFC